jgi:O-antigen ligase
LSRIPWLLLGLLLFLPWWEGGAEPTALVLIQVAIFVVAGLVCRQAIRSGSLNIRLSWAHLAYMLFLITSVGSFASAGYLYASFETLWDQSLLLLLALSLAASAPGPRFLHRASLVVVLAGMAQALPMLVGRLVDGVAVSPSFLNPNHTAAYLNIAASVAWIRSVGSPPGTGTHSIGGWSAWRWRAAAVICAAGTLATGSRGGILAAGLVIVAVFVYGGLNRRMILRVALPLGFIFLLAATFSIQQRFSTSFDPYRYTRVQLWKASLSMWKDSPLLGVGPGMYEFHGGMYNFPTEGGPFRYTKFPDSAHSQPLQLLAEQGLAGLVGMILFTGVFMACLRRAARENSDQGERNSSARMAVLACGVVGVHALVEAPFAPPAIPLTILLLAWPALHTAMRGDAAWSLALETSALNNSRLSRWAVGSSVALILLLAFAVGSGGPYFSYLAAGYAQSPGVAPVRIDLAARISQRANPYQPFLGYRRARAAIGRAEKISPVLLGNATESLERTARIVPSNAWAPRLLGRLFARAASDLPGAGDGALRTAERQYSIACRNAHRNALVFVERGRFRLFAGDARGARADAAKALSLEPMALTAHLLAVEAYLSLGAAEEAAEAMRRLDAALNSLEGYRPKIEYEEELMLLDGPRLVELRQRLEPS